MIDVDGIMEQHRSASQLARSITKPVHRVYMHVIHRASLVSIINQQTSSYFTLRVGIINSTTLIDHHLVSMYRSRSSLRFTTSSSSSSSSEDLSDNLKLLARSVTISSGPLNAIVRTRLPASFRISQRKSDHMAARRYTSTQTRSLETEEYNNEKETKKKARKTTLQTSPKSLLQGRLDPCHQQKLLT